MIRLGDCVRIPDGRIGRVRQASRTTYRVRVRRKTSKTHRKTSKTHQFLVLTAAEMEPVDCPTGWMSPTGDRRYLPITLAKMRAREAARGRRGRTRRRQKR